ncbi:hypothetical protein EMIHUDRAFT_106050 [Emiliania huxleyi CCMP1516]|uniref:DNA helicase n=2 Tax=Emiliania huxleyi TaxID=2903 RepID=A0A0D3IAP4_EMIH1|nr:hypothetical protein EMIHUDRAFT_106050 [Emiliania huxleyi CCMP1516]EOD08329.1 hypothetical protein EMIHUDRAFT_106050 [Emiliania huxleyi CCMP1516]|eukprot:XP_005760758.1 hypothetical protein EMIHUDRAFT_106050 [Emiliania huxleyi CCMP1516]
MADFDLGGIFFTDQSANNGAGERLAGEGDSDYLPAKAQLKYREFLRDFRREEEYIYRSLLRSAIGLKQAPSLSPPPPPSYLLRRLRPPPSRTDPAAIEAAILTSLTDHEAVETERLQIQVTLTSSKQPITIREMLASTVAQVVTIPGIVIASSKVKAKGTEIFAQCASCQNVKKLPVRAGFAGAAMPRVCDRPRQPNEQPCPLDPYVILPEKCKYVDQQTWKLQESPEMVDRRLVDRANPGDRVTVTGIMSILSQQGGRSEDKKDKHDAEFDGKLAKHIINLHVQGGAAVEREVSEDELDVRTLKRYIAFARKTCSPRLSTEAAERLNNYYVEVRKGLASADAESEKQGKAPRAVPITVRQLEALVRISESHAKMRLDPVKQAIELFTASTLQAAKLGEITLEGGGVSEGLAELRQRIEGMVAIGQMRGKSEIISQAVAWGFSERDAENAIRSLVGAEQFEESRQGRRLKRVA